MSLGGLLAFFGQTYQTGADSWQLFALWAALDLPPCRGARSDFLWTAWGPVAMAAIGLWMQTHLGGRWSADPATSAADLRICGYRRWRWALLVGLADAELKRIAP